MVTINTEKIASSRRERGLTITALAKAAGMSYRGCWNICRGKTRSMNFDSLGAICSALHIEPGELLVVQSGYRHVP